MKNKMIILSFLTSMISIKAHSFTAKCHTMYNEKIINITNESLSIKSDTSSRHISSSNSQINHRDIDQGFVKTMQQNDFTYKVVIHDKNKLSEENDFLTIASAKGHKITYPLVCHKS